MFLIFSAFIEAQEGEVTSSDGTNWIADPEAFKIGYVSGYLSAMFLALNQTMPGLLRVKSEDGFKKLPLSVIGALTIAESKADSLCLPKITVGQIRDGLNAFYEDFSTRKVKVIDAIYVVKMQINGQNPDLIAAQVRFLKMQPISNEDFDKALKKQQAFNDLIKAFKEGQITEDDFLKTSVFIDKNGDAHFLFCYGKY
jgi:hypothetical protein